MELVYLHHMLLRNFEVFCERPSVSRSRDLGHLDFPIRGYLNSSSTIVWRRLVVSLSSIGGTKERVLLSGNDLEPQIESSAQNMTFGSNG